MIPGPAVFRSARESDLDAVRSLIRPDAATPLTAEGYRSSLADRQYRPEWTWVAADEGTGDVLAAAIWWGAPTGSTPGALDAIYVHESVGDGERRTTLAADLLGAAHRSYAADPGLAEPPAYHVFVPSDWRERPDVISALTWRREAVALAGLGARLERLRYEWTPEDGIPSPTGRLVFRAEPDDEVFVDVLARVVQGSLDSDSTTQAAALGAEAHARSDVEHYRNLMLGERSWWLIAENEDGETVGFGIPSRNPKHPVVGYLGVVPEHRGHGYIDEILAQITRVLVAEAGAERILADTDLVNKPMAASFERVGYKNFARRLVFSAQ
jgi:RimJ/RimL family protein N-acetyltransferase